MREGTKQQLTTSRSDIWELYLAFTPRRSIEGILVFGLVWRQRQEGRWLYMKADKQVKAAVELVNAAHHSRLSRRLRRP